MELDFEEEKQNLNSLLADLNYEINKIQTKVNQLSKELKEPVYGYDDRDRWFINKDRFNRNRETLEEYCIIKKCPYFGRIDLESDEEAKEYYIGEKGLMLNFKQRIIDWRTELGNIFYSSSKNEETNFIVCDTYYNLLLRREITIKNSTLISCKTTFNQFEDIFENGVVDSFLIDVLKDKRRSNAVTNIIKTIQYNQNEIMRKPLSESFVVQGCAGSGKTMILLHRLSFLLFNDYVKPEQIKVVTPNKYFDSQIDNLSKELGLELIQRYTIEDYYKYLLELFPNGKLNEEIESEMFLPHDMLYEIYSQKFKLEVEEVFKEIQKNCISLLNENKIRQILESVHFSTLVLNNESLYGIYQGLKKSIDNIIKVADSEKEINSLNTKLKEIDVYMENQIPFLINAYALKKKEYNKEIEIFNKEKDELETIVKDLKVEKKRKENEKVLDINYSKVLSMDYLLKEKNELTSYILNQCIDEYNLYLHLFNEFKSIPQYNFMRRNNIKKQMNAVEESIIAIATVALQDYQDQYRQEKNAGIYKEIDEKVDRIEIKIKNIKKSISDKKYILNRHEFIIGQLKNKVQIGLFMEFCSLNGLKDEPFYGEMLDYVKETREINKKKEAILNHKKQMDLSSFDMNNYENLKEIQKILSKMSFNEIYRDVYKKTLSKIYEEYKFKENKKMYRHNLFFRLLLNLLYYKYVDTRDILICIDEAQDYSFSEYSLFKSMNTKASFNLYGDINQIVFEYETLMDWSLLEPLNIANVYVLNQNYRNTEQITEFCNDNFGSEMIPIGIKGKEVKEENLKGVLNSLKSIQNSHKKYRSVIIYKTLTEKQNKILSDFSEEMNIEMNTVVNEGISILPINLVKGMEFDAVAVLTNGMEFNEQYVAFTRALDNLYIVR